MKKVSATLLTMIMFALIGIIASEFQQNTNQRYITGNIEKINGEVWLLRNNRKLIPSMGDPVSRLDQIITKKGAHLSLLMEDGSRITLGSNTEIILENYSSAERNIFTSSVRLLLGQMNLFIAKLRTTDATFNVQTTTAVLGVRGTEFLTRVSGANGSGSQLTEVELYEGKLHLAAANSQNESQLTAGQRAVITAAGQIEVGMIAAENVKEHVAYVGNKSGEVWIIRSGEQLKLQAGSKIRTSDYVVTSDNGKVELLMSDTLHLFGHKMYLEANSAVGFETLTVSPTIQVLWGDARFAIGKSREAQPGIKVLAKGISFRASEAAQFSMHINDRSSQGVKPDWDSLQAATGSIQVKSGSGMLADHHSGQRREVQAGAGVTFPEQPALEAETQQPG